MPASLQKTELSLKTLDLDYDIFVFQAPLNDTEVWEETGSLIVREEAAVSHL